MVPLADGGGALLGVLRGLFDRADARGVGVVVLSEVPTGSLGFALCPAGRYMNRSARAKVLSRIKVGIDARGEGGGARQPPQAALDRRAAALTCVVRAVVPDVRIERGQNVGLLSSVTHRCPCTPNGV